MYGRGLLGEYVMLWTTTALGIQPAILTCCSDIYDPGLLERLSCTWSILDTLRHQGLHKVPGFLAAALPPVCIEVNPFKC